MSERGKLSFRKMPLLMVLVAMVAGILVADAGFLSTSSVVVAIAAAIGLYIAAYALRRRLLSPAHSLTATLCIVVAMASLAALDTLLTKPKAPHSITETSILACRIDDIALLDDYTRLRTTVIGAEGSDDAVGARLLANIYDLDYSLLPGDVIASRQSAEPITNLGNPDEFDYASYMARQGFFYRQKLKPDSYVKTVRRTSLLTAAATCRLRIADYILSTPLSERSQQFLIAVLLGDRTFIDDDDKATFATAGLAHVLALSGLHVGLIALFIYLLLFPVDFLRHGKRLRLVLTFIILTGYAFLTGFSPSVTRALVMYAFAAMALLNYRHNESLNALCGAAVLLLAINPQTLYDTGAQMSFLAVAGILTIGRELTAVSPKRKFLFPVVSTLSATVGATTTTGIAAAYYFNSFPAFFIVSNIVVVPLLPFILGLGLVAILSGSTLIATSFDFVYDLLLRFVRAISEITPAAFTSINVTAWDVAAYFIVIALALAFLSTRRVGWLTATIASLAVWIGADAYADSRQHNSTTGGTVIFSDRRYCPIVRAEGDTAYIGGNIDDRYADVFALYNRRFMARRGLQKVAVDSLPELLDGTLLSTTVAGGRRMVIAVRSFGRTQYIAPKAAKVDYLVVTGGFNSAIHRIAAVVECDTMIVATNAGDALRADAVAYCASHDIPMIDMRMTGAVTFP